MKKDKSEFSFSLTLKSQKVTLDDNPYTIKELTGAQRDEQLDSMKDRMKFNEEGKTIGVTTIKGIQSGLLALCLHDSKDNLVKEDIIIAWPNTVIAKLYKIAQDISGLVDSKEDSNEKENELKND